MSCAVNSIATSTVAIASAEEREGEIVVMNLRSAENAGATELNLNYCYLSSLPHALAESHYCRDNLQKLYLKGNIICQMVEFLLINFLFSRFFLALQCVETDGKSEGAVLAFKLTQAPSFR